MKSIKVCAAVAGLALSFAASGAYAHKIVSNTANLGAIAANGSESVSVSCGNGHVTGGGYTLPGSTAAHFPLEVMSSMPADSATWAVEVVNDSQAVTHSKPGYSITVYAICTYH